ncbi:MAG: hypothetical protein K8T25_01720 [Planctomycetia bacterium]|nr:hypothetical protein [Planctomycetia bacterium]
MWEARVEQASDNRVQKFQILRGAEAVRYADVLTLWQDDAAFQTFFIELLAGSPFRAFRWETPPLTSATGGRAFEFVLLRSDGLDRPADRSAFAGQFAGADPSGIATFANLGGDAVMVVPCPLGPESAYCHLASFTRSAPQAQQHALWQAVGNAMQRRLGERPVWLSTAGMGVAWLHVRLDDRPKYYGHGPYTTFAK